MRLLKNICLLAVASFVLASVSTAASAAAKCGPREMIVKALAKKHNESLSMVGVMNGKVMEIFASPAGSFSVLMTYPVGLSCMVADGTDYEVITPDPVIIGDLL